MIQLVNPDLQLLTKSSQFDLANPVFMGFHKTERFTDDFTGIVVQAVSILALTRDSSSEMSDICINSPRR